MEYVGYPELVPFLVPGLLAGGPFAMLRLSERTVISLPADEPLLPLEMELELDTVLFPVEEMLLSGHFPFLRTSTSICADVRDNPA